VPLLVDGNNLAFLLAGRADRAAVRQSVLDFARHRRVTIVVVFDGAPPEGSPDREILGRVTILYSGLRSADDVIVRRIPRGGAARSFTVVTDDHGLAARARETGARVIRSSDWLLRLRSRQEPVGKQRPEAPLSPSDIAEWEAFFSRKKDGENAD